jgi:pimeloyl-ACP methyl ester carboxylesterase
MTMSVWFSQFRVATAAWLAIAAAMNPLAGCNASRAESSHEEKTMKQATAFKVPSETTGAEIRPFHVHVPQAALDDLRRRIAATQWPEKETVDNLSQGVPLALMQEAAHYWATEYDWRKVEAKLNALPQFVTTIDGLDIHFIHVRSRHPNAMPLIITHGWPGSIIEQMKLVDPLTNPTAHGGRAADAFDVVIPSMPGYGFSGKPTTAGWDPPRIARAWAVLMERLGYKRYVATGGDWGGIVVDQMGVQAPPALLGIHTNFPGAVPSDLFKGIQSGAPPPSGLSDEESRVYEKLRAFFATGVYYAYFLATRPQTMYGIADSPIGLAAFLIDHGDGRAQPAAAITEALRRPTREGDSSDTLTRDDVLDNITLYWLTNTGVSSGRLYWENKVSFVEPKNVTIPVAVSAFPNELFQAPRSWTERAYPNLIYYNKPEKGGHFAAWEEPQLFAAELRAAFKSLR